LRASVTSTEASDGQRSHQAVRPRSVIYPRSDQQEKGQGPEDLGENTRMASIGTIWNRMAFTSMKARKMSNISGRCQLNIPHVAPMTVTNVP